MRNRTFRRIITTVVLAGISGLVALIAQHYARGTILEAPLDPLIPYIRKIISITLSPRGLVLTALLVGAALALWAKFIRDQWIARSQIHPLRKLVAMTLMMIFGAGFALSSLWYFAELLLAPKAVTASAIVERSDDGLSPEQRQRKWLLETRSKMELAVRNAAGTPVSVIFEKSPPTKQVVMNFGGKDYQVGTSMSGATSVWIYGDPPIVRSYTVRTITKDKPIDVRTLRENRNSDAIQIGERAFFKFEDGRTAQLLLVGVQYYSAGDDIDEARFKYKIYDVGEFLIDPL